MNNTYMAKKDEINPDWFIVDAEDMILGRLASFVASRIRGKHKPEFTRTNCVVILLLLLMRRKFA